MAQCHPISSKDKRLTINKYFYLSLILFSIFSIRIATGDDLPAHCKNDPDLAGKLTRMGPVMGLGSSVSHGVLARSASEIVADQLCLGSDGHFFPWYYPASDQKRAKRYYKRRQPGLVFALDITYHDMKDLEFTSAKKRLLDTLVPALALDCESDFYDCSPNGNESYAQNEHYRPIVLLGDLFFENLIDCSRKKSRQSHRGTETSLITKTLCFEEYAQLNRHLMNLADKYPNLHIYPANHSFTALTKYPFSIFYDEGTRQTFFNRKELTWDGWHPYTDPGSKVFANLAIMYINRLIKEGKINASPIPLVKLSDEYFGPPSGLMIIVPDGFPPVTNPRIVGPNGQKVPLRFSLSRQRAEQQGVFTIGKSYLKARALSWKRIGPKPFLVRAQSFSDSTIVLSRKDQDTLTAHHRNGIAYKGALLLIGEDPNEKKVSHEDTLFLNQITANPGILKKLSPDPITSATVPWEY